MGTSGRDRNLRRLPNRNNHRANGAERTFSFRARAVVVRSVYTVLSYTSRQTYDRKTDRRLSNGAARTELAGRPATPTRSYIDGRTIISRPGQRKRDDPVPRAHDYRRYTGGSEPTPCRARTPIVRPKTGRRDATTTRFVFVYVILLLLSRRYIYLVLFIILYSPVTKKN